MISPEDFELVAPYRWHIDPGKRTWYARTTIEGLKTYMHTWIMGSPPVHGLMVDHINGHGWDNRRENLRWATPAQNAKNLQRIPPPFKGIYRKDGEWYAIGFPDPFSNLLLAALAYDARHPGANFINLTCGACNEPSPPVTTSQVRGGCEVV